MSEKEEKATPPVIPKIPSAPTTPTKVLVREWKRESVKLGERSGSVTWEQPAALQSRQYPFWYRYRAAFGSLIIVNVCIGSKLMCFSLSNLNRKLPRKENIQACTAPELKLRFLDHQKGIGPVSKVAEAAAFLNFANDPEILLFFTSEDIKLMTQTLRF